MIDQCNEFLSDFYTRHPMCAPLVLEAGGGSFTHFVIPPSNQPICLDISFAQLEKNETKGFPVQADLHRLPIAASAIDIVICFNVIEHLDDPKRALEQLAVALRPNSLLILGFPERTSLKGWITRLTPIGFHRWYYKNIVRKVDRGDGHFDAFETPFKPIVGKRNMVQWLDMHSFEIVFLRHYDGAAAYGITSGSALRKVMAFPYYLIARVGRILSGGRWDPALSDVLLVARKSGEHRET